MLTVHRVHLFAILPLSANVYTVVPAKQEDLLETLLEHNGNTCNTITFYTNVDGRICELSFLLPEEAAKEMDANLYIRIIDEWLEAQNNEIGFDPSNN